MCFAAQYTGLPIDSRGGDYLAGYFFPAIFTIDKTLCINIGGPSTYIFVIVTLVNSHCWQSVSCHVCIIDYHSGCMSQCVCSHIEVTVIVSVISICV